MRLKYIMIVIVGLGTLSCNTQEILVSESKLNTGKMLEPGKCYFSGLVDKGGDLENAFILTLISPKYEMIKKTYLVSELESAFKERELYPIRIEQASIAIEIRNEAIELEYPGETGYLFCMIEKPSRYLYFDRNEIKSPEIEVKEKVLKSCPKIIKRYVKKKPRKLKANEFYFEAGSWTGLREWGSGTKCPGVSLVSKIKEKLNSLGYDLEVNNLFDEKTKKALIDFQKKNNLAEGQLNLETLKKLEINY